MDIKRIVGDTQVSTVACFLKMITLDDSGATSCQIYNAAATSTSSTVRKLTLRTTAEELTEVVIFPGRGLRLPAGCYINWNAGEIFYAMG